jgi:ankyrin repeat protein
MNPIFRAIEVSDLKSVKQCLNAGVPIRHCNKKGREAIYVACQYDRYDIEEYLLKNGARVIVKNGSSPLSVACSNNNLDIAKLLVKHGTDKNTWICIF